MEPIATYTPSGRNSPRAYILGIAIGVVAAVGGGFVYQLVLHHLPIVYLGALATAAVGYCLGLAVIDALRVGRSRSPRLAVVLAIGTALAAEAASFVFAYHLSEPPSRQSLLGFLESRVDGGWELHRGTAVRGIHGAGVLGVWLGETLLLAGAAVVAVRMRRIEPFCESCGMWTVGRTLGVIDDVNVRAMSTAVERGGLAQLMNPERRPRSGVRADYTMHECPHCGSGGFLSVHLRSFDTAGFGGSGIEGGSALPTTLASVEWVARKRPHVRGDEALSYGVLTSAQRDAFVEGLRSTRRPVGR